MHCRSLPARPARTTLALAATAAAAAASLTLPALAAQAAPAASHAVNGPDVSSYQHPNGHSIAWTKVRKAGAEFAIIKATEGSSYVNPYFASDYRGAAAAGLVRGSYHFARPATPVVATAKQQADYFAARLGRVTSKATLPPALDFEATGGLSRLQLIRWAQVFLLQLRHKTGRTPMLYTYPSFWSSTIDDPQAFVRYPIWMASYTASEPSGATLWQYTSAASVRGISGGVDMSRFVGTKNWPWTTLSDGTVATPWQASGPGAPWDVRASLAGAHSATVSWQPGDAGTSRITGYRVTSHPGHLTAKVGATATAARVKGLSPGTSYTFTVQAANRVGLGTASNQTGAVISRYPTHLSGTASAPAHPGQRSVVKGTLTGDGESLSGQTVTLQRLAASGDRWRSMSSAKTGKNGGVQFIRHPRRSASWRLVFAGNGPFAGSSTGLHTTVRPTVTAQLKSTAVVVNHWVVLTGTIAPTASHVQISRQVKAGGRWVTWKRKTVTAGNYRFAFQAHAVGTHEVRVYVAAASGRGAAHSAPVTFTVSQR